MRCRGVLLVDQIFGASDEVLPRIVLRQKFPCEMPVFAVLATAPDMRYREDTVALEPRDVFGVEERIQRNAVGAVSFQKRGIGAIELHTFSVHDGKGDQCSVVAL